MKHTQGKLSLNKYGLIKIEGGDDFRLNGAILSGNDVAVANTRRLVACWNAMEGIENPEMYVMQMQYIDGHFGTLLDERNDLVKERDELIARHNGMIAALRSFSSGTGILDLAEIEAIIEE